MYNYEATSTQWKWIKKDCDILKSVYRAPFNVKLNAKVSISQKNLKLNYEGLVNFLLNGQINIKGVLNS